MVYPESESEIIALINYARTNRKIIRVVGAGHSSMPLVETPDILISLERMKGLLSYDFDNMCATLLPGYTVGEASKKLLDVGLALHNTGDVDMQLLVGAIGTGTHGTGHKLQNLSAILKGGRMINGLGEIIEFSEQDNYEFLQAARVSLGSLGIFTAINVQCEKAFKLHRREYCVSVEDCLQNLDQLIKENRNLDFYWYPRSDIIKVRIHNKPDQDTPDLPFGVLQKEKEGWIGEILPQFRHLKYDEMEYALPAEAGPDCFVQIRKQIKAKHRKEVAWRVLYRTVAADDSFLSPFYIRDSVTIAILHNIGQDFWSYFKEVEPILREFGGRPHWGKKHSLKAGDLKNLYPKMEDFLKLREVMDPERIFVNEHIKELFGI